MDQAPASPHFIMFVLGIAVALSTATLMVFTEIDTSALATLGLIGVVMIAAGRRRMNTQ